MAYFDHLALAVDFSEPSKVALQACRTLVDLVQVKEVSLLHAVKHVVLPQGDTPQLKARLESMRERIQASAKKQMVEMCKDMRWPEDVKVHHRIIEGSPSRVVPEAAVEIGASALLVGTHSRKGIKRWLQGSIAEKMAEGARLPILVLPMGDDGVPPDAELAHIEHILVAVDVHAAADRVVRGALEAATCFAGQKVSVTLLTVADLPGFASLEGDDEVVGEFLESLEKDADEHLVGLEARHGGYVEAVRRVVRRGDPDEQILKEAAALGARLIVMGSHGQDEAPFLQIGSTTAHVVRSADVSVLVVPSHPDHA